MTSTRRGPWVIWVGLIAPVLLVIGLFAAGTARHQRGLAISTALARGETPMAPSLTLPALDGPPLALSALRGHPVILNFWASWCAPCREEAPQLEAIWKTFGGRGLIVVGVDTQDLEGPGRAFLAQYKITYPNVRDPDGSVGRTFGTTGVPETFFIGADGRIKGKFPGERVDPGAWQSAAEALLAGKTPLPGPP